MSNEPLPLVYISEDLAQRTASLLDSFAQCRPSEGVVYWFGIDEGHAAVVTTLIVPDADTTDGVIRTSASANADAIGVIVGSSLVYLGQAHSHPGANVGHSHVDDRETFARCDGILSIVVPWFGRYGFNLAECGVHRHIDGRFRRVNNVDAHIRTVPGLTDLRTNAGVQR
jgi:hypothetical protein